MTAGEAVRVRIADELDEHGTLWETRLITEGLGVDQRWTARGVWDVDAARALWHDLGTALATIDARRP